ncbi:MAG: YczE/YyaS/YitT family protein [Actinomycetota bacterium]
MDLFLLTARRSRRPRIRGDAARALRWLGRALSRGPLGADRGGASSLRRLVQLFVGLIVFGVSLALMVRAGLGLGSWDVLHQGLARQTGLQIGSVVIGVSVLVLLLWIPLRERPGFGTVANAVVVGLTVNASLMFLPTPRPLGLRLMFLIVGIVANGVATGMYIGAGLGPGPRDGLMTGLARRGYSIRAARTLIELTVLVMGWALGGSVGLGTVLFTFGIGPLAHYFIPKLAIDSPDPQTPHGCARPAGHSRGAQCCSA